VPVSFAMKKPCSKRADWVARNAAWSCKVRYSEPLGQLGVAKERDVRTPVQSGVLPLKYGELYPLLARLAL